MKKIAALCIAALGAALLVVGTAPSASAYPELTCTVEVDKQKLKPGESFTVTGKTPVAVDSNNNQVADADVRWTFKWNGLTKERTGRTAKASFTAPEVSSTRKIRLTGRSTSPAGNCVHFIDITVIGPSSAALPPGGGLLPNTGGPAFWMVLAALAMMLIGTGAVITARKRA